MMSRPITAGLAALLLAGCGGSTAGPDGAPTCRDDCLRGWWTSVFGGCGALCSLSPQPRECAAADCEHLEVREYSAEGVYSYFWLTHSPAAREFTLIGIFPEEPWELTAPCELSTGDSAAQPFTCVGSDQFSFLADGGLIGTYLRASPELQAALEAAVAQGQCEHTY